MMPLDPIVGGVILRIPAIQSPNFLTGVSGWQINQNGNAEFNNGTFRGLLTANSIVAGSIGSSVITGSDFQGGTMEETVITFDSGGGQLLMYATTVVTTTITAAGTGNYTVPAGITLLTAQTWGSGAGGAGGGAAGGANSGGYGGGAGGFASGTLAVTPLASLPYLVSAGGAGGAVNGLGHDGGDTEFNANAVGAHGGKAATDTSVGLGGLGFAGSLQFTGGNGGKATGQGGTGGGSSAGTSSSGNNAPGNSGSGPGAGGTAVTGGGAGGNGGGNALPNGIAGSAPGGAGGGGEGGSGAGTGAAGGGGKIVITYTSASTLIGAVSAVAGTDAAGNAYAKIFTGQLTAFQPGSSPTVAETWHNMAGSYLNAWSDSGGANVVGRYRLLGSPPISVQVMGIISHAAGLTATSAIFTMPAGYMPLSAQLVSAANLVPALAGGMLTVSSTGSLNLSGLGAATTIAEFNGIYSLD